MIMGTDPVEQINKVLIIGLAFNSMANEKASIIKVKSKMTFEASLRVFTLIGISSSHALLKSAFGILLGISLSKAFELGSRDN